MPAAPENDVRIRDAERAGWPSLAAITPLYPVMGFSKRCALLGPWLARAKQSKQVGSRTKQSSAGLDQAKQRNAQMLS